MEKEKIEQLNGIEDKNKYCDYCGKLIGKPNKIYIAGSICQGHRLTLWQYIIYKLKNFYERQN